MTVPTTPSAAAAAGAPDGSERVAVDRSGARRRPLPAERVADALHRVRWVQREAALRWRGRCASTPAGPRTGTLVVVSPHLDDAVLSCAGLLAARPGARVVTTYTAGPPSWAGLTDWDRSCGFRPGDDVMAVRKREDLAALAVLAAAPVWLDVVEGQYAEGADLGEVARRLGRGIEALDPEPSVVAVPLGVGHPDHVRVSDAMLALHEQGVLRGASWLVYGDLPYAGRSPDLVAARTAALAARGLRLEPHEATDPVDTALKTAAVGRYRTQIRPLWRDLPVAPGDERLWRLR